VCRKYKFLQQPLHTYMGMCSKILSLINQSVTRHSSRLPSTHSEFFFPKSSNTSYFRKYSSLIYNSCFLDSPYSKFTLLGVSKPYFLELYINLLYCRIILMNSNIFLFSYIFITISQLFKSCEYDLWELFVHLALLVFLFFSNPSCT
jgi:hypothetical protein